MKKTKPHYKQQEKGTRKNPKKVIKLATTEVIFENEEDRRIRTRTSPKSLFNAIQGLKENQRNALVEMGFEGMLGFRVDGIPSKLGFYVVDNFDHREMRLHLKNGSIEITTNSVHDMFGIPNGPTKLEDLVINDEVESSVSVFKEIHGKNKILPNDVAKYIASSTEADWNFKMNFLVLFANIMGESMHNGYCTLNILSYIQRQTNVRDINWCGYIMDCLKRTKEGWSRDNPGSKYSGPLTFLTVCFHYYAIFSFL